MTETKQKRKPSKYTDEFKQQLVDLYHSGKRRCDICREYDIAHSLFDKWVKQAENSGSFHKTEFVWNETFADLDDLKLKAYLLNISSSRLLHPPKHTQRTVLATSFHYNICRLFLYPYNHYQMLN